MHKVYVVDTGALLSMWAQESQGADMITVPSVVEELQNRPSQTRTEMLISTGRLREEAPTVGYIAEVKKVAQKSGDFTSLSDTDIELLALALSKKEADYSVTIVSTDLSLLNTARFLKVDVLDTTSKFTHQIKWILKCPACGHTSGESSEGPECPVCGTTMRRHPVQRKSVR